MKFVGQAHTTPNILATDGDDLDKGKHRSDRVILISVILLMIFGLIAVYSAIAFFAETKHTTATSLIIGHLFKVGIAFIVMVIFSKVPYQRLLKLSRIFLFISWIFLLIVSLYGTESFGAKRWINIAGFSFQPSSLATVSLIMYLVSIVVRKQEYIKDFKRAFTPIMVWITVTCGLIGIEDLSSAAILMGISLLILFVGRANLAHIGSLILIAIIGFLLLLYQNPERLNRINTFVDQIIHVKSDTFALDDGYQSQQAHIAFARGEWIGVGIGKSSQRNFLPAPYNDFIFAIIGEEYGLMGAGIVLFLFVLILFRGFVFVARRALDLEGMLLATALTLTIAVYGFVNAAVACGVFPVTGLPMPFVSYGGTSMMFSGMMVGIILNISKYKKRKI